MTGLLGLGAGVATIALLPERTLFRPGGAAALPTAGATGERWACAMMDFIGNAPGDCPVCGMKLAKVTAGELAAEQARRMGLETTVVAEGPAVATIRAYGVARYDERTARPVIPRVGGRVVKRYAGALHEGELVAAGEALVDLYSPEAYAAQGELAAAVKLGDAAAVSALQARFERWNLLSVAESVIAGEQPSDTVTVVSPFSGRAFAVSTDTGMAGRMPEVGDEWMAERPLVRLVDPEAFIVAVQVPENRARWIREGQAARLASDDYGDLSYIEAVIGWVSPQLDLELRTREAHVHLREAGGRVLPGSLVAVQARVALGPDLGPVDAGDAAAWGTFTLVPKTAVLSTGVRNVVWKVAERQRDGRVRLEIAPVALGPRLEDDGGVDFYVVRAGLAAGDEVATQGAFLVDSQAQLAGTPSLLFPMGANAPAPGHQH